MSSGASDYEVAERVGVPRATIQRWRRFGPPSGRPVAPLLQRPLDDRAYAYVLGIYLGDGWLTGNGRTWGLGISLDARHPRVIDECAAAIEATVAKKPTRRKVEGRACVRLYSGSGSWPSLIPQHGPGKKHEREIRLQSWQQEITRRFTREFIRGLIHSDGSRCINRFAVTLPSGRVARYAYPRYFFTNHSADIRGIFCEHCELLGVRWTQSNPRNISVSHRDSVAILDSFVGPKR